MSNEEIRNLIANGEAVLGIEFGSTRIKAVLVDSSNNPVAAGAHEWENRYENGVWTYSLEDIDKGLKDCYADLKKDVQNKYGVKLTKLKALGFSAMMHGYMAFNDKDELLVPFRTWRNTITEQASEELTKVLNFHIPQRWSIAHLYQAILNDEPHVKDIKYVTTLAVYIHRLVTGNCVAGVGEASGMFPIDSSTGTYYADMAEKFNNLEKVKKYGFDILKQNMRKLDEIKVANDITVDGIKNLTEKISGISDIARIINGIADQTNIIAFNAELEASSAGDIGENFSLVANEIRRLTNSTIQSTNEIRKRISEIQHSSDALLHSSQDGSRKILDGTKIISELNNRFDELKKSSDTMDFASVDIKKIIDQQTASFAQIVVTLRQIAQATETFSGSTKKISESAHNLCVVSNNLKQIQPEEAFDEENAASEVRK